VTRLRTAPPSPCAGFAEPEAGVLETIQRPGNFLWEDDDMNYVKLHVFDLRLCHHVLDNILGYMNGRGFAAYVKEEMNSAIRKHLLDP
jgi:hypothetical protein